MSIHSLGNSDPTPHGEDSTIDVVQERYLEELREGRADNSGGWSDIRSGEVPLVRADPAPETDSPRIIDPDREQLEEYSPLTEEERLTGQERYRRARAAFDQAQRRVGVRAVTASDLIETPRLSSEGEVIDEDEQRRIAKAEARRLSIETGKSHKVVKDAHGNYVVELAFKKRK